MAAKEFFGLVTGLFVLMGALSLVELFVPLYSRDQEHAGRAPSNLGLTILTFLANWLLDWSAAVLALWLSIHRSGVFANSALPLIAKVAITVILLDVSTYFAHLTMH